MNRPKLIVLCGIPGAGKTSFAKKLLEDSYYKDKTIHLSSDKIREELYGNEATQGDPSEVFSLMQTRAIEALNNGQNVIYDSTAMTRKDRAGIIAVCPKFAKIECYVVWAPIEVCSERDAARERSVGKEVIDMMLKRFQAPYYDEGFENIWIHCSVTNFDKEEYMDKLIDATKIPHDNPHHTLDIFEHCCAAARYVAKKDDYGPIWLAAAFHDIGKPYVKAFVDSKGNPCEHAHYYQHQCISAWEICGISGAIPESEHVYAVWLISTHMDIYLNTKYYKNLPTFLKRDVDMLYEADLAAH